MLYTKDVFPVWLSDVESKRHRSRYRQVPEEFYTVTGHRVVTPDNVTDFLAGHCGLGIQVGLAGAVQRFRTSECGGRTGRACDTISR